MNKQEFITLLEKRLFELPQVEKEHLLNYYNETIEDRIEDGMSEAEAVASLDSVEDIVKQIYSERAVSFKEEEKPAHSRQRWRIVLIVLLSPFWATLLCVFAMIYLLLWTLIALLFCSMLAFACFIFGGIWNLILSLHRIASAVLEASEGFNYLAKAEDDHLDRHDKAHICKGGEVNEIQ